jgi:hypothetical protein
VRLVRAELLKARRRTATYVILVVDIVLMALTFLAVSQGFKFLDIVEFPAMYSIIGQFAFGLGGLLGLVYAATFVGADWNWGVIRNVVARGESRAGYLLAKGAALAILLFIAMLIIFALGIVFVYVAAAIAGVPVASPLRGNGLQDLLENLVFGYPVLLQRAAIGLAIAVLLRSQLAGAVVGIVLYLGEAVLTQILTVLSFAGRVTSGGGGGLEGGLQPIGPEWYQFLPISIGGNVLNQLPGSGGITSGAGGGGGLEGLLLKSVPFEVALPLVFVYLIAAVAIGIIALQRQEIT